MIEGFLDNKEFNVDFFEKKIKVKNRSNENIWWKCYVIKIVSYNVRVWLGKYSNRDCGF